MEVAARAVGGGMTGPVPEARAGITGQSRQRSRDWARAGGPAAGPLLVAAADRSPPADVMKDTELEKL